MIKKFIKILKFSSGSVVFIPRRSFVFPSEENSLCFCARSSRPSVGTPCPLAQKKPHQDKTQLNPKIAKFQKIIVILATFLFPVLAYAGDITITVLYNNVPYNRDLTTAWGISCLIRRADKDILFDTGGDGGILLSNMKKLGVDPHKIDIVVLSHIHGDHVGGLWSFLKENNKVKIYLPDSFPERFKDRAKMMSEEVILVHKPIKICEGVWSTGELGTWIKEQSLIIDSPKGLIVITGCAHPGVINIVKKAKDMFKKEVLLVAGGFHLMAYSESQVKEIIRELKALSTKKVAPSHCTGGRPIELFKEAWREDFFDLGCGAKIKIEAE